MAGATAAAATTAATALEITQTLLQGERRGRVVEEDEEGEEEREMDVVDNSRTHFREKNFPPPPKKRAVLLTAFVVCISFLIFLANVLSSLMTKFLENDRVWNHLALWVNATMPNCVRGNKTFSIL